MTEGEKSKLIYGGLALFFAFFLAGYLLEYKRRSGKVKERLSAHYSFYFGMWRRRRRVYSIAHALF